MGVEENMEVFPPKIWTLGLYVDIRMSGQPSQASVHLPSLGWCTPPSAVAKPSFEIWGNWCLLPLPLISKDDFLFRVRCVCFFWLSFGVFLSPITLLGHRLLTLLPVLWDSIRCHLPWEGFWQHRHLGQSLLFHVCREVSRRPYLPSTSHTAF